MTTQTHDIPAHIPSDLVRDFDYLNIEATTGPMDVFDAWKKVQDEFPDIFWTPRHGGHWVFTRAEDIEIAQVDWERFSMRGHAIPMNLTPNPPLELDPPEHTPVRRMLSPFFSPKVVRELSQSALEITTQLLDEIQPRGHCEFVSEFARQLPVVLFLRLMDLPLEDRFWLQPRSEIRVRGADAHERNQAKMEILDYLEDTLRERRAKPGNDLISKIMHGKVGDAPMAEDMMKDLLAVVLFGGLDTVASQLGFVARHITTDLALRARLIADPSLIPQCYDELARRYSLVTNGRLITEDMIYKGVLLKAGEQVMVSGPLHSLDERRWPDPMKLDISRKDSSEHAGFGNGPHRCPGSMLARAEVRVFMEEWLKRIPDFEMDPDKLSKTACGRVSTVSKLYLRWPV